LESWIIYGSSETLIFTPKKNVDGNMNEELVKGRGPCHNEREEREEG